MSMASALARDELRKREAEFRAADRATRGKPVDTWHVLGIPHTDIMSEARDFQRQIEAAAKAKEQADKNAADP